MIFFGCPRLFWYIFLDEIPHGSRWNPEDCQNLLTYGITSETQLHGSPKTFFSTCGEVSVCGWGTYCTFENLEISSWVGELHDWKRGENYSEKSRTLLKKIQKMVGGVGGWRSEVGGRSYFQPGYHRGCSFSIFLMEK